MLIKRSLNKLALMTLTIFILNFSAQINAGDFDTYQNGSGRGQGIFVPWGLPRKTKVDEKTPLKDVFRSAFNKGIENAVEGTTRQVVSNSLNWVPESVAYLRQAIMSILYKAAFGTHGFTTKDLININNRISYICTPFIHQSASALDLKRRSIAIEEEESEDSQVEQKWQDSRNVIIRELNHGICYLKKALACYDILYLDAPKNGLKYKLAKIVHLFSAEDCFQITTYSIYAIEYIEKLINIFQNSKSREAASKRHDEIQFWLGLMNGAFEMVTQFLEGAKSAKRPFSKVNASSSSKANAIESLLGSLGDK